MHIKDRVIIGPIKNQLRGVQSLGDVASFSKAPLGAIPRLEQRSGEESIISPLVSLKGRRRNSWGELGVRGNLLHIGPSLQ